MPRKCSICNHEQVEEINTKLIKGNTFRNIGQQYGIDIRSLHNHKDKHLPAHMVKAKESEEVTRADNLLGQVQYLQDKAMSLLEKAEKAGDMRTALQGVREARSCLELLAKMQGELQQEGTINITLAPEWMELRAVILQAVEPFPDARESITEALRGLPDAT